MNLLLKQTFRNIQKNRLVPIVKIVSYTIAFTIIFFAIAYCFNEINYNKYFVKEQDVYQAVHHVKNEDTYYSRFPNGIFGIFSLFPEIKEVTRIIDDNEEVIAINDSSYFCHKVIVTDSCFFNVFKIPIINGSLHQFKTEPNSIIITKKLAKKLFGKKNPVGKNIMMGSYGRMKSYEISGVIENWPVKSSIQADIIHKKETIHQYTDIEIFFSTKHGTPVYSLNDKLNSIFSERLNDISNFLQLGKDSRLKIIPVTELHFLSSNYNLRLAYSRGDKPLVISILSLAIGVFIIILVNNTILMVGSLLKRMKEIGIRKTFGATSVQIFKSLSIDNMIFVFIACLLSIFILFILNTRITNILYPEWIATEKGNTLFGIKDSYLLTFVFLGLTLFTICTTSFITSIYVSRINTIHILQSKNKKRVANNYFANSLVVTQLIVSILIIVSILTVYRQLKYTENKDYGYDLTNVFTSQVQLGTSEKFREELLQHPDIEYVTFSPKPTSRSKSIRHIFTLQEPQKQYSVYGFYTDYYYTETFSMKIVEGRTFNPELNDKQANSLLINETAARLMTIGGQLPVETNLGTIIGIVKDFHIDNLKIPVLPIVMYLEEGFFMSLKVKPQEHSERVTTDEELISYLVKLFKQNAPGVYKMYTNPGFFINRDNTVDVISGKLMEWNKWRRFGQKADIKYEYTEDKTIAKIGLFLTILAIIVSSMGLFSVSVYMSSLKTKEVGIRKVNGAKTNNILILFTMNYTVQAVIAIIIALPVAYYGVVKYLETYSYHMIISWWLFVLPGLVVLFFVLIAVSWQSWKAASRNPVEALRYE